MKFSLKNLWRKFYNGDHLNKNSPAMPLKGTTVEPLVSDHPKREDFVIA